MEEEEKKVPTLQENIQKGWDVLGKINVLPESAIKKANEAKLQVLRQQIIDYKSEILAKHPRTTERALKRMVIRKFNL